jgi:hypothetical protein
MKPNDVDGLFTDNDPLAERLWEEAGVMVGAPPRPAKGYVTVPLSWLARVLPAVRSVEQLVVLLLVYRQCLLRRSRTVELPNGQAAKVGLSRYGKYRALARLQEAEVVVVASRNGRSTQVTLREFP